jgi:hypothetical protein
METVELQIKNSQEPPYGTVRNVLTPWGAVEKCNIIAMRTFSPQKEYYAFVDKPVSNPGVSASCFKLKIDSIR